MPGAFAGRVAVVTGGASGIGWAIAERFAEAGASVGLLDIDNDRCHAAAAQIEAAGGICAPFATDVGNDEAVVRAVHEITARFGRVDHLVNNAGIVLVKGIADCTVADWDRVMDVNLKSVFLMAKHLLPMLIAAQHSTIVNIGSVSSFVAQQQTPAYVASKGAVLMLTKALALDLAPHGIRVNCVCPGITDTPMLRFHANATPDPEATLHERSRRVPLQRMLNPREIADTVLYLSSERSSGITGASLVVDAGYISAAEFSGS